MRVIRLNKVFKMTKMVKLFQILDFVKLFKKFFRNSEVMSNVKYINLSFHFKNLIMILFVYLLMTHWMACLWNLQASFRNFDETTWIA
jgi:hypothetical protein